MSNTCSKCKGTGTIWREGSIHGEDFCDMCGGTGKKITAELVIQLRAELAHANEIIRKLKEDAKQLSYHVSWTDVCGTTECVYCGEIEGDAHSTDCPMTKHIALMKELE